MKTKSSTKAQTTETVIVYVFKLLYSLVHSYLCFLYDTNLTEIQFFVLSCFCFSLCCSDENTMVRISKQ